MVDRLVQNVSPCPLHTSQGYRRRAVANPYRGQSRGSLDFKSMGQAALPPFDAKGDQVVGYHLME